MAACSLGDGHHDVDPRAVLRLGGDGEVSSHEPDALLETDQPQATASPLREIESSAVVADGEPDIGPFVLQGYPRLTGLSVHGGVLERLLRHAIEAQGDIGGH